MPASVSSFSWYLHLLTLKLSKTPHHLSNINSLASLPLLLSFPHQHSQRKLKIPPRLFLEYAVLYINCEAQYPNSLLVYHLPSKYFDYYLSVMHLLQNSPEYNTLRPWNDIFYIRHIGKKDRCNLPLFLCYSTPQMLFQTHLHLYIKPVRILATKSDLIMFAFHILFLSFTFPFS